tara:strand:+ start:569 stop:1360 length:792 start_codon:yes stop_codon:yes gene_type:complete
MARKLRTWATSGSIEEIDDTISFSSPTVSKRFDIDKKARDVILKKYSNIANITGVYKETLRSVLSLFSDFVFISSENDIREVKCIFSNPERPIAKQFQENNIVLPVIAVSQVSTEDDSNKIRYGSMLVHEKYWDNDKKRAIRVLSFPSKPVRFRYQIGIWAKYRSNLDQILEQIRIGFTPNINVPTKYTTLSNAFIESEEDFSDIALDDKQERLIKKGINIIVETFIPSPKFLVTSTGEIEKVNVEHLSDSDVVDGRKKDLYS